MLDAFIIDRIRQRQGQDKGQQEPLHIIVPQEKPEDEREAPKIEKPSDRGCEVIDFTLSSHRRIQEVLSLA